MAKSDQTDYARFYEVLKKATDSYQRGLDKVVAMNLAHEDEIYRLKQELSRSREVIGYLKQVQSGLSTSREDVNKRLSQILGVDLPTSDQNIKRKSAVKPTIGKSPSGHKNR